MAAQMGEPFAGKLSSHAVRAEPFDGRNETKLIRVSLWKGLLITFGWLAPMVTFPLDLIRR